MKATTKEDARNNGRKANGREVNPSMGNPYLRCCDPELHDAWLDGYYDAERARVSGT